MHFFKRSFIPVTVDLHSHLIPGVDDGADSVDMSLSLLHSLEELGFQKIITTPHIHPKYPNTPQIILEGLRSLKDAIDGNGIGLKLETAAEYYVDENFLNDVEAGKPLLSFGDKYVLIECSFINKPLYFETAILKLNSHGYRPVFAHPERYQFLQGDITWLRQLREAGLLLQVTLSSLSGYYGKMPKKIGERLIKENLVDFLATDLHKPAQLGWLEKGLKLNSVQKLIRSQKLLNPSLL